jgi:hypothetical protein
MNFDQIINTDLSSITSKAVKDRRKEFKKLIPNAVLVKKEKNLLRYKSQSTRRKFDHEILVKVDQNDLYIFCSCEAFSFQGFAYRAYRLGCGIKTEKREDSKWRKYHGPNSVLCKHLWILFHKDKKELKKNISSIKNNKK